MEKIELGKKYDYEQYTYYLLSDDHRSTYKYDLEIINTETGSVVDNHCMREVPTLEVAQKIVEGIINLRRLVN